MQCTDQRVRDIVILIPAYLMLSPLGMPTQIDSMEAADRERLEHAIRLVQRRWRRLKQVVMITEYMRSMCVRSLALCPVTAQLLGCRAGHPSNALNVLTRTDRDSCDAYPVLTRPTCATGTHSRHSRRRRSTQSTFCQRTGMAGSSHSPHP